MDSEEAWDEFRKSSTRIQKTSIAGKLDTLAAALQEIKVDTERTAAMVPKIMGDEAALDSANADAMADLGAGGDPGMGMGPGGEEMMNNMNGPMPPDDGGDMGPGADPAAGDPGMGAPDMGAPDMGAPDMGAPAGDMGGDVPPMEGPAAGPAGGDVGGEMPTDTDMGDLLDGSFAGPQEDSPDMTDAGLGEDMGGAPDLADAGAPPADSTELNSAANNLLMALKQAAHQAVDSGDTAKIVQLSQIEQQITQALGSVVNLSAPDMTTGPGPGIEDSLGTEMPSDEDLSMGEEPTAEAPLSEEASEPASDGGDIPELVAGDDEDDENYEDDEDEVEDEGDDGKTDSKSSSDKEKSKSESESESSDDKKDEKKDEKKEDDSAKKSASVETYEDIEDDIFNSFDEIYDEDSMQKSSQTEQMTVPSLEDLMSKQVDMLALIKSTTEDVDENEIFHEDNGTEALEASATEKKGDDTMCNLLKSDDRIATARSIFDIPMESGITNPDSIATAGEAQTALNHTGSQDPDSISSADAIIEITKSAEDISKPKENSGSTDPDSIATAEPPEVALSHKGKQDPDSIATADEAVDMDSGDDSEGTKTTPSIGINKSKVGREILSLQDMMRIVKSDSRPSYMSAFNSELERPELGDVVRKSASPVVKIGRGVDPMDVIKNDLEQYNLYKARNKF